MSTGLSLSADCQRHSPAEKEVIARWIWPSITQEKGNGLLLVDVHKIVRYQNIWSQCKGLNKSLTTLIIGHTVTSKVTEMKASFEHLFTPCLLSVSLVLHLVNTKLGSPAFKVLRKIGNKYGAGSHVFAILIFNQRQNTFTLYCA